MYVHYSITLGWQKEGQVVIVFLPGLCQPRARTIFILVFVPV